MENPLLIKVLFFYSNGLTNFNKPKTLFDKLSQNGELQNG